MIAKRKYLTIFIIQVTEVLGFSLILPFLPFYAQKLGASPLQVGLILTTFSLTQFFSAPIMGRLSDSYGRKPLLIFSQLSTFVSFIVLGLADCLALIFVSRLIDGLLGSNFTIAQAYLSDLSSKEERTQAFGISGVAFGLGFLVGPAIGGFLSRFGYYLPALLAAGVSSLTIVTTVLFLEETVKVKKELKLSLDLFNFSSIKRYFLSDQVRDKLWLLAAYLLAHVVWVSNLALFAQRRLGFMASQMGYILAYIGLISIVFRGWLLNKLIAWCPEGRLRVYGGILMVVGLLLSAVIRSQLLFILPMTLFALGTGVLRPLLLGELSRTVSQSRQGEVLGVASSLGSFSRVIGPLIGGMIINYWPANLLGVAAALIMLPAVWGMARLAVDSGQESS